ncbi:MAG: molybdate ABC transporter permease subunit, partial [Lachnospiraceae bacterium]|nr:molybdate ABC transporter permease subunit [Lachnospiraceae bacterium]
MKSQNTRVIPGFSLTIGITITMLSLFILIPLASVLVYSLRLSPKEFLAVISDESVVFALITSIGCALGAALINCLFGLILAWVLVRCTFPGK